MDEVHRGEVLNALAAAGSVDSDSLKVGSLLEEHVSPIGIRLQLRVGAFLEVVKSLL